MKILVLTIGSHGDVHPFVGIAAELHRRGHDVSVITNQHFENLVRAAGLKFLELGSEELFQELMRDPDLWHPLRGFDAVFMRGVLPGLEQAYDIITQNYVPGETIVVSSSLGLGARIAQDKLGFPMATVHVQPGVLRTVHDPPKLPMVFLPRWMPIWMRHRIWASGDRCFVDPKLAPTINPFRAKLGLPPVSGFLNQWWHSPDLVVGLWPEWYAATQPDWPAQTRTAGFPLYDETGVTPVDPELDAWLSAGDPPIAFTPGSAMLQGESFFAESARACAIMGRRGLLLTRHAAQIPGDLPKGVRHFPYAPFGQLLPRCTALVHHGGIGTTSQALRAGIPQLIMPMAHDQFDNARRVEQRLGVGASIKRSKYRARNVANKLIAMLASQQLLSRCQEVGARFNGVDGIARACDLILQLTPTTATTRATDASTESNFSQVP